MNLNKSLKLLGMICMCGTIMITAPGTVKADEVVPATQVAPAAAVVPATELIPAAELVLAAGSSTEMVAKIDEAGISVYADQSENSAIIAQAENGSTYDVLTHGPNGWAKVNMNGQEGYIKVDEEEEEGDEAILQAAPAAAETGDISARQQVVDYALQFVGGRYVYGGNDPHSGVDCSGFTRYVMQHGAGISLNRSSGSQASQGRSISAEEIQPGDLVFYSSGRRINHVALYIGNGQIVHASTARTGIKISNWTYRSPIKIVSVFG
ncbi:MAG: C40 family peptidase [Clostridium sp.]